ncbi:lipo-like protein [Pseudaestuariivita atlantica]|uniref:Lipo-like protein n=2 Tax=Pseudaestuariivita atlantica TaxID=1317121 RepID=A0A0L1JSB4_9RHOB|nr:lipo-like protein [Pseudaestuariivita atlantica]
MESRFDRLLDWLGSRMAVRLATPTYGYEPCSTSDFEALRKALEPGDVLLVEGNQRISGAIKYLTQSTWSHAAMFVGDRLRDDDPEADAFSLVEVNLREGCVAVPLDKYASFNTRICRPVGLNGEERRKIVDFMIDNIGLKYDLRNILDLLRYYVPQPPVPVRWRRRMIALGSGAPTRAICSSLIAQAFQSVRYPILPDVTMIRERNGSQYACREVLHIRHHSLFAPRDFDLSPYFEIVKPTIAAGFDFRSLEWHEGEQDDATLTTRPEPARLS